MAEKKTTETAVVSTLNKGTVVRLNDGTLATVTEVGVIDHLVQQTVPVRIISYRLNGGPFKGAEVTTPLRGEDEIEIVPATRSFTRRLQDAWRTVVR